VTEKPTDRMIPDDDPIAIELVPAVHAGDVAVVRRLLAQDPGLASARIANRRGGTRTPLLLVSDWPGYFPNGPQIVRLLIEAGADVDARTDGGGAGETPLHWAASSDDVDVAEALIDGGADVDARDGSIGTPLANAIGYGCWHVARLLVTRGASVDEPWQAAALGMLGRLEDLLGDQPDSQEVSKAFWHACSGGQRRAAQYLLSRGADLTWIPDYAEGTPLDAARGRSTRQENVITWLREQGARSSSEDD
jgi:hypothetical protein